MFDRKIRNCIIGSEAAEMPLCQDHRVGKILGSFKFYTLNISFCSSH